MFWIDISHRDAVVLMCLIAMVITQFVATIFKRQYKRSFTSEFSRINDASHSDEYLNYYKKVQLVDIYRTVITIGLVIVLIWRTDSNVMQAFAIATWAIIIVFQSLIMSVVIYLMLLPRYKVWETIKVGGLGQWEIIYIKPLHLWLAGRNQAGEHTGEFYLIPNNKVRENPIIKVDYNLNAYQKIACITYYDREKFDCSFDEYMMRLTEFLNKLLPLRSAKNVWHYKSYIGHKYKLNYDMKDDGVMEIWVWFVVKQHKSDEIKRQIYSFVQGL
jgi:hypothetical protein